MKRRTYRAFICLAVLAIIIAVGIAGISLYQKNKPQETFSGSISETSEENSSGLLEDSYFEITFFDVGEGDSTLVKCDGQIMLIDGGLPGSSSFLYSYLMQHGIDYLDYIVCTHAHEDHVGGLSGALNYASVGTVYAPVTEFDSRAFRSFVKYLGKQGKEITVPSAGDSFMLGSASVQIVGPVDMGMAAENVNNTSIVLHIVYGETSFLVTGDAEAIEEESILDAGYDIRSDVLRVGHHGSYTSTSDAFLEAVSPDYCVISVGKDNAYGHPHDVVLDRIGEFGAIIYRTDLDGYIACTSDGENVTFRTEK